MNILAKYLLLILFLIYQSAYAYNYDADTPSEQFSKITSEGHFKEYDDTSNPFTYREHEHKNSNSQEKAQGGSFFAFEVGFVAAKGTVPSIKDQALELKKLNNDKNTVTVLSGNKKLTLI